MSLNGSFLFSVLLLMTGAAIGSSHADNMSTREEDKPYQVDSEGNVDWYTFSGYKRYHAECHVCHGPAGLGSSFAPALIDSMRTLGYDGFVEVVVNGRENITTAGQQVMPSFAANRNVMCFVDDIYAYLSARADGAVGKGRPSKLGKKPDEISERDRSCLRN